MGEDFPLLYHSHIARQSFSKKIGQKLEIEEDKNKENGKTNRNNDWNFCIRSFTFSSAKC